MPGAKARLRKGKTCHITITVTVRQLGILVNIDIYINIVL